MRVSFGPTCILQISPADKGHNLFQKRLKVQFLKFDLLYTAYAKSWAQVIKTKTCMATINSLLTILLLIVSSTTILGQQSRIGIIDFYGTNNNETELRKCLPFIENDSVQFLTESSYPKAKKAIVECLLRQSTIKQADISFVCCVEKEGKWIVFVGVDTKSKDASLKTMTNDVKLPAEMKNTYDSLMKLLMIAIQKGESTENDSNGHSIMTYLPAQQLQKKFITYANENLSLLKEVLKSSKHADQRQVAATVIAYYHDKTDIIDDLLGAVTDPDEHVRNNAVRAIGIIVNYSQNNPDLKIQIPADPFIDMLNSISWTDRNKSSFVLLSLTLNRDKRLLNQLKEQALKPIVDMAKWKSAGHSMPGFVMLGRIAEWSDKEIMDGLNGDKKEAINKMLVKINN